MLVHVGRSSTAFGHAPGPVATGCGGLACTACDVGVTRNMCVRATVIDAMRQTRDVTVTTSPVRHDRTARRRMERLAREIRLACIRDDASLAETVDRIRIELPDVHPLEVHRWARGWHRGEVSVRIDGLYEGDGLAPPGISDAELCRWEHGQRRPSDERIDYLCRLYATRPDRLGFGQDYSGAMVGHLDTAGIVDLFPHTNAASKTDLVNRIRGAREHVTLFGLTRNFYATEELLPLLEERGNEIPVRLYIMDPHSASRADRYRIEPSEAAMEDPNRYVREALRPLSQVAQRTKSMSIYLYDFPCSFAIESIDNTIRVMLYGHAKRGTDGPIFSFQAGTEYYEYFADQVRWLDRLASSDPIPEPWLSKGIKIRRYAG